MQHKHLGRILKVMNIDKISWMLHYCMMGATYKWMHADVKQLSTECNALCTVKGKAHLKWKNYSEILALILGNPKGNVLQKVWAPFLIVKIPMFIIIHFVFFFKSCIIVINKKN